MKQKEFELTSHYKPAGDQPEAIKQLSEGIMRGDQFQTLLGVTGSGKTFTISNVVAECKRPALVISPNKTLAAQLYGEFKQFFPDNSVEFFISYYDYYQPEAYIPTTDTYIEKDFAINDEIDRLRLRATSALVEGKRDVIIIASVSCIYGIGDKESFSSMIFHLFEGQEINRKALIYRLTDLFYQRNDFEWTRGTFRVRGDVVDVMPAQEDEQGIRIEMFGDTIEKLSIISRVEGQVLGRIDSVVLYPARQFVTPENELIRAMADIKNELSDRLIELRRENKLLEAQRLEQRTLHDLEMMKEVGYCSGIENYSMHLTGRKPGDRPQCLFDYFPEDFLLIIDESHVTLPQLRAMYNGDRKRKTTLVEHGFRLPSALENRPLRFEEIESLINQAIFVSATPADYELQKCEGVIVEQVIRPTGLLDPAMDIRPVRTQIDDLLYEIRLRIPKKERVLVTTLTKRMAEDLSEYLTNLGIKVAYIHSEIDALERVEILRNLRLGEFDVLVGVNLLREGLDMPEVSLVAILDADKEGFLRSERSLLQIAGRTARNADGLVILYADTITRSMQAVLDETNRRREKQIAYNTEHGINPTTVYKSLEEILQSTSVADIQAQKVKRRGELEQARVRKAAEPMMKYLTEDQRKDLIEQLYEEMKKAARDLDFERAAELRDEIERLRSLS
ncbi:MAG: excinuclease ABC subunit UvrB [Bacteroidetes bacterium]|nr:excinuclease ABC subunit UvrB [bacterium]NBP64440.1 excinuclease ABC subunit UvrB [Bacteroidota bacterium]